MPKGGIRTLLMVVVGLSVVVGGVWLLMNPNDDSPPSSASQTLGPGASGAPSPGSAPAGSPQPPGPAPPGKVWHAGHGHWHDAPAAQATPGQAGTAPPPGDAPPGKVWNAEHGHYHDAPAGSVAPDSGGADTH